MTRRARPDWAAGAVYAASGAVLSWPPHALAAWVTTSWWGSPHLAAGAAAAAVTGLTAGLLAACTYGFGTTPRRRLVLAFAATWGAAVVAVMAQFYIGTGFRPIHLAAARAAVLVGVFLTPAGLVPWGILERMRRAPPSAIRGAP